MSTGDVPGPWLPSPHPHLWNAVCVGLVLRLRRLRGTTRPGPRGPRHRRPNNSRPLGTPPYGRR